MLVRRGVAASPGVVVGPAFVLGTEDFRIPQRFVAADAVEPAVARFRAATDAACGELQANAQLATERLGQQYGAIFGAHVQMLRDPQLVDEVEGLIRKKFHSPEYAASRVFRQYARKLQNLGSSHLAERAADLFDLERRILKQLLGERREELANLTAPVVILANNLTPSQTAGLDRRFVRGFATESGGPTSHTAILAGALEIPAVVGVGRFLDEISGGETIIIDGTHGEVIVDPDPATIARYQESDARIRSRSARLESLLPLPARTADGVRIVLLANIEFPEEVEHLASRGADGVGLYRTEFLWLGKDREPLEEDHYEAYRRVVEACPQQPVVVRTLDLGADKVPGGSRYDDDSPMNTELGLRSIRLSLSNLPAFKTQLRAILRAAVLGDVRVMFPLIATLLELRQAKMILQDVAEDLADEGIPHRAGIPVGMMVEVPAAALLAEEFAREVDFFSVGTNDLIQYTLAVHRSDPLVSQLYSSADPSVLRLLQKVLAAGAATGVPVTVCGQMSGDPVYLPLLLGLGLRSFSAAPHAIPELKEVLRHVTIADAERIAEEALRFDVARDIEQYLKNELKKICGEPGTDS